MPVYGIESVYGSPLVYGQESVGLRFVLEVDWWGNGYFNGLSEWGELKSFTVESGRKYFLRSDGKGFEQASVGKLEAKLNNRTGRYNPYNISSPLHPYVRPRQLFRLRARYGLNVYDIMVGRTSDIRPIGGIMSDARLVGEDAWEGLRQTVSAAIQENKDSDYLLGLLLDEVGWQWGRDIGSGAAILSYWWCDGESAKDALHTLAHAELGQVWIDNAGTFKFRNRHHIPETVATITGDDIDKEAGYSTPQPWDIVKNRISIKAYPQVLQSESVLWELTEKTLVPSGQSKEIWVSYFYDNQIVPAKNVVTSPAKPTDFRANTAMDESGTDLTDDWTVMVTPFSKRAKVTFYNGSDLDGYIIIARVRGQAITSPYTQAMVGNNPASQNAFGVLDFELDNPWLQDISTAQNFANYYAGLLGSPRPYFDCWLLPNITLQLGIGVNKRYALDIPELGINGNYTAIWFGHYWDIDAGDGVTFKTRVLFEPSADIGSTTYMQFPYQFEVNSDFAL